MRYSALATGLLALALPACATFDTVLGSKADDQFENGIVALQRGDFESASKSLSWVIERHRDEPVGQQALLVVSALEMDPRNPSRRLALGADLAGAYLQNKNRPEWSRPVAQTLYLLALEMGATEERLAEAEAEKREAERKVEIGLPSLPTTSSTVPARLRALSDERDKLARRVELLESQVADRDKKLDEKEKELERIRKTLKR